MNLKDQEMNARFSQKSTPQILQLQQKSLYLKVKGRQSISKSKLRDRKKQERRKTESNK